MPYRLSKSESIAAGLKRIAREELESAIEHLTAREGSVEKHVHEARKSLKKLRGLQRLIRDEFAGYRQENAAYRDIGRALGEWRESSVARKLVESFLNEHGDAAPHWTRLRDVLDEAAPAVPDIDTFKRSTTGSVAALREAALRVDDWDLDAKSFDLIGRGLRATYKRVCRYYKRVRKDDDPELSHAWRRHVKYHWYHIRLLEDVWPERLGNYRETLAALGECLGSEHDLIDLRHTVKTIDEGSLPKAVRKTLCKDIERERLRLHQESIRLGEFVTTAVAGQQLKRLIERFETWTEENAA